MIQFLQHCIQASLLKTKIQMNELDLPFQPCFPMKSIARREEVVPHRVIKWVYREGIGNVPSPGQTIFCIIGVSLLDGTQIMIPRSYNITKYLFGRGRLIEGLQLAFADCRKSEVFKVKVSSDYAYGDRDDIKLIPPLSTLIFDIIIVEIVKQKKQSLLPTQLFLEVQHLLQLADDQLRKKNIDTAIQILKNTYKMHAQLSQFNSSIWEKIVVKMANILANQNRLDDGLKILSQYQHLEEPYFLRTKCKIKLYEMKREQWKLRQQMLEKYRRNSKNQTAKRVVINYLKKMKDLQKLKSLQGYDYKSDSFVEQVKEKRHKPHCLIKDFLYN